MIFKEFEINSKVYYFFKFIIILLLILIIYKYYFTTNLESFTTTTTSTGAINLEAEENINSVFNENNLIVGDLVIKQKFNMLPKGSIVAWTASDGIPPPGWAICDGITKETPDLRGRFIVGSGQGNGLTKRQIEDPPGGEEKHMLLENEIPSHGHTMNIYSSFQALRIANGIGSPQCNNVLKDGSSPYNKTLYPNDGDKEVETVGHNNMPPFYILYYIMKL